MYRLLYGLCTLLICCQQVKQPEKKRSSKSVIKKEAKKVIAIEPTESDGPILTDRLYFLQLIKKVARRAAKENYNTKLAILTDLGLHSGSKRIFVVDLQKGKIIKSGLVTHGSSTTYQPIGVRLYSNVTGSLCSSLGMYKIGGNYQGQFGLAYKLYGLDKENSKAFERAIVLHSHSCVPDEVTDEPICQSWGCPTVSPAFLKTIVTYIDKADKPVLLYIFDSTLE